MNIYKILSVLLCYPEQALIDELPVIYDLLDQAKLDKQLITPLLLELSNKELIALQEEYVQTFDRTPTQSLHLFEHIHGEDRMRGTAMVDLMEEYKSMGFDMVTDELPDYLPLFLEFLSVCNDAKTKELLGSAIDVISHIGKKLEANNSTYVGIFNLLETLSPVQPQPLTSPPIRDMDEALEKFGPTAEGVEPLLQTNTAAACASCTTNER